MPDAFDGVRDALAAAMEEHRVPGGAVAVLHDGVEHTAALGVTSVDNPLPVTADTLFQWGSITKTVTATALFRLAEEGRLDLDEPVLRHLPVLRLADENAAARVTTRHLLTHTGGWEGDLFDDFGWGDDALALMVERLAGLEQLTPLGEIWSYNNAGFYLAGRLTETLTGSTYEDAARELVLEPLGVEPAFFFAHDVMTERFAVGHELDDDEQAAVARPWPIGRAAHPAGGVVSGVGTLLHYGRAHLEDPSLAPMREPVVPAASEDEWMALGWFLRDRAGVRCVEHGGSTRGQNAWLTLVPEHEFVFAVATNGVRGQAAIRNACLAALREHLGVEVVEPEGYEPSADDIAELVGTYRSRLGEVELRLEDGRLVLQQRSLGGFPKPDSPPMPSPPPTRVELTAANHLRCIDGPLRDVRAQVLRDAAGGLAWLRFGLRIHRRVA
jgi:CubicO group peptidase (beta-lactamase class C family)